MTESVKAPSTKREILDHLFIYHPDVHVSQPCSKYHAAMTHKTQHQSWRAATQTHSHSGRKS